ncbi:MAG: RIP metalloprotease RseP, partial [Gemmatimonadaceae bacterium]
PGDTIFQVNGHQVDGWSDIVNDIALSRANVTFGTQHGNVVVPLNDSLTPLAVASAVDYWVPPVVDSVLPNDAAAAAGLQPGDSIAAIDGVPTHGFADLIAQVSPAAGSTLVFTIWRQGKSMAVRITPRATPVTDPQTGKVDTIGRIGVAQRQDVRREPVGLVQAVVMGGRVTGAYGSAIVGIVHDLVVRKVSVKELGGPIAITRASVHAAENGWASLLQLIAFLSINVAVLNLLPIPILDGGSIVMNVIETAKGSPFSDRTRENILRVGLVVIALLFVLVMFNDTTAWLGHLFS